MRVKHPVFLLGSFIKSAIVIGLRRKSGLGLRQLKPEEKVNMAIDMTDVCVSVCAEGIRAENPTITEKELVEKLRERLDYAKQMRRRWRHGV